MSFGHFFRQFYALKAVRIIESDESRIALLAAGWVGWNDLCLIVTKLTYSAQFVSDCWVLNVFCGWHWLTPMTNEEQVKQIVERRITHSIVTTDSDLLMTSMIYWEFSKYAKTLCLMPERINFFEIFELSEKMIQKRYIDFLKLQNVKFFFFQCSR